MKDIYRMFPPAAPDDRLNLKLSIESVGLRCPVVVDDTGNVIDGHERRDICIELGIDWLAGADVRIGLSHEQRMSLAIELNLWRRPVNLTRAQRTTLLDIYLSANPHLSDGKIAALFGIDQSTTYRRRQALMQSHKLPAVVSTVGKDGIERRIGDRNKDARFVVKSKGEYESLRPSFQELGNELVGLQRRPKRLLARAARKRATQEVQSSPTDPLPFNCWIEHCDFRQLALEDSSVDVILTDVVWTPDCISDWEALAALASRWLKDDGVFCSIIGQHSLPHLCEALSTSLHYQWTVCLAFGIGYRNRSNGVQNRWRPAVVFSKSESTSRLAGLVDVIHESKTDQRSKKYHDWQQGLELCTELTKRLTRPGDTIVDPHLGTGTYAVACQLLGNRNFVGCDIDDKQVRTARHRVSTEGVRTSDAKTVKLV